MLSNVTKGKRDRLAYVGALILLPLFLLAINNSWVFGRVGYTDPWIYAGYELHPSIMYRGFYEIYYGTRIPWIAFGWAVHQIFGIGIAPFILRLSLFYLSTFSLFATIERIFANPLAAFISACLLGTNSWFLWAIGWDYVDGPSIAFYLLSFAALAGAARGWSWRFAAVLWGFAVALMLNVFIMLVVFLPVEIVAFLLLNRLGRRRATAPVAALFALGFVGATLIMGLASLALGGEFLFFVPQITAIPRVIDNLDQWYAPLGAWIGSASWLLFPAFALLSAVGVIVLYAKEILRALSTSDPRSSRADLAAIALACVLAVAGFALMEVEHYYVLQIWYRANALWPPVFIVIGALFAVSTERGRKKSRLILAAAAMVLCLAPWTIGYAGLMLPLPTAASESGLSSGAAMVTHPGPTLFSGGLAETLWVVAGAGLLAGAARFQHPLVSVAAIAFLAVVSALTISPYSQTNIPADEVSRDRTLAVFDASHAVESYNFRGSNLFWFDQEDPERNLFYSVAATYLQPRTSTVDAGTRLVIIASKGDPLEGARTALAPQHLVLAPVGREHIQRGRIGFDLVVADVSSSPSD